MDSGDLLVNSEMGTFANMGKSSWHNFCAICTIPYNFNCTFGLNDDFYITYVFKSQASAIRIQSDTSSAFLPSI